jgi:glycosyltransferase involved in cell wall biosynthesis
LTAAKDFHLSKARNLGVAETNEEWIFFCDADTLLDPTFFKNLDLKEGNYYTGEPDCSGNCIVKRSDFMGYDENIKGYGGAALTRHLNFSTRAILSSKTLKRNSRSSTASLCKFSLLIVQTKSEHFLSRPTMSNKVLSAGLIAGKTLSAETYTKKPRHSLKT